MNFHDIEIVFGKIQPVSHFRNMSNQTILMLKVPSVDERFEIIMSSIFFPGYDF